MDIDQPVVEDIIEQLITADFGKLHPAHLVRLEMIKVTPRRIPISDNPGEFVNVIAEHQGRLLFYSELEEAWGLAVQDASGGIADPGENVYQLTQLMNQLFGAPNSRTCGG